MAGQGSKFKDTLDQKPMFYYNYPPWYYPVKSNFTYPYPDFVTEFPPYDWETLGFLWARNAGWKDMINATGIWIDEEMYLRFDGGGYSDFIEQVWYRYTPVTPDPYLKVVIPNGGDIKSMQADFEANAEDISIKYQGSTGYGRIGFSGFRDIFTLEDSDFHVAFTTIFADKSIPSVPNSYLLWDNPLVKASCSTDITYRRIWNGNTVMIITCSMYCRESGFFGDDISYVPSGFPDAGWFSATKSSSALVSTDIPADQPVYFDMFLEKRRMKIQLKDAVTGEVYYVNFPITYTDHYASTAGSICYVTDDHNWYGGLFYVENKYGIANIGWKVGSI